MKFKVNEIVYIGILSGLVLVGTFINVMLPFASQGGLVHFGTPIAVVATIVYGRKIGTAAGAIGMTIFDIMGGWFIWAPATFVARLGLGYILGSVAFSNNKNGDSFIYNLAGLILGGVWMLVIYYLFEAILYNNWVAALGSIPGNATQLVLAAVIGIPIGMILKRYIKIN